MFEVVPPARYGVLRSLLGIISLCHSGRGREGLTSGIKPRCKIGFRMSEAIYAIYAELLHMFNRIVEMMKRLVRSA